MKNLILSTAILLFAFNTNAQNTNKQTETKTTTRTVKDSDGEHQTIKKEQTQELQKIELGETKPNTINVEMRDSPIQKVSTTQVTNPDGSTRTVDVDRSSYYESNGKKYQVSLDASGYTIMDSDSKRAALLRKTSTNSFIYRNKNKISIGYFDINGNLILETYDEKSDKVRTETYMMVK
ncbi:MAG: hypothetical protein H7174_13950 [Flavobacterium sp.]|nr:hypothetical protein [Flavobacterium sp.]